MNIIHKKKWLLDVWRSGHRFTFLFHVERWNDGDEWRVYFLFWEFNLQKNK